jgi:hypothetical protein
MPSFLEEALNDIRHQRPLGNNGKKVLRAICSGQSFHQRWLDAYPFGFKPEQLEMPRHFTFGLLGTLRDQGVDDAQEAVVRTVLTNPTLLLALRNAIQHERHHTDWDGE